VNLLKPKQIPGTDQEPSYSLMMLFSGDADLSHMRQAMIDAAKEKWGDNAKKIVESPKFKDPFKDQGDQVNKQGELYAGMTAGAMCVQASCKQSFGRPGVVDLEGNDLIDADDVYSGAYYRATVKAYAWEHPTGGKGVSFGLQNVQKLAEGEKLGGGRSGVDEDFEPVAGSESAGSDWDD